MANPYFRFKQFTVYHDQCAMKVGTDGVLLGAWVESTNSTRVLDIGAGSGLVSLMIAQRSLAQIEAIDIDEDACIQSVVNFRNSPFSDRIKGYCSSLQDFSPTHQYDLIVSNPPFFSTSLKSSNIQRNIARHNDLLSREDLFSNTKRLLCPKGIFCLIVPIDQYASIAGVAEENKFFPKRKTVVFPTPESKPKRILLEYTSEQVSCIEDKITIETSRHIYSEEFTRLTCDFYL
jgi:Predicted O-methyltransferase